MRTNTVTFDPELIPALEALSAEPPLSADNLAAVRAARTAGLLSLTAAIGDLPIDVSEHTAPGPAGAPDIALTVLRPRDAASGAAIFNIHGGGMVLDTRFDDNERLVGLVSTLGLTAVTVEYRLAPEHPAPAGVEDCYAGLCWAAREARKLGFNPTRLLVMGGSAGGGLSAGVALMARDRSGPTLAGQMLLCPMIDDRPDTASARQFEAAGTWQGPNNRFGWASLLGNAVGTEDASPYAAPARAKDLSGLPPAFIEVGSAELFRDEDVSYATRIWATGGQAELHVWAGGYHGFDRIAPNAAITQAALACRENWLRRVLGL